MGRQIYPAVVIFILLAGIAFARGRAETSPAFPTKPAGTALSASAMAVREKLGAAGFEAPTRSLPAAEFELDLLGGGRAKLSAYRGSIVLLNFWATWCPSCREEIPSMERLYDSLRKKGLVIVAVDLSESTEVVKAFVKSNGMTFPVLMDTTGDIGSTYGVRTIPTTYVIGRDGNILGRTIGSRDWSAPASLALFTSLLAY